MISKVALALAMATAVSAAPNMMRRDDCQNAYSACIAAGTPEIACSCTLTACLGEDNARNRDFCATATASLPTSTGIPGGCNPAHPGSCPSSYFTYPTITATATPLICNAAAIARGDCTATAASVPTSTVAAPLICNAAAIARGDCTATAAIVPSWTATPSFTSIVGIPGGCNPAHPGSCPSSYFTYTTATPSATPSPVTPNYGSPTIVEGKTWTVANLTRYCAEDASGCDYNFAIEIADKTERCTVIRMPGSNAATESWYDQPCTTGSEFKVSWGYATEPGPAFAVLTVVDDKELAFFGVSNVNGNPVTPSSPFGSGQYGSIGPQPVYTY